MYTSIVKPFESVVRGHILIKKKYVCLNSVLMYYDFQLWFRFLSKHVMRLNINAAIITPATLRTLYRN